MTKYYLYILAFLLFLSFSCNTTRNEKVDWNENTKLKDSTIVKKKAYIFTPQVYNKPKTLKYFPLEGPYLIDNFRPIGFSDKGMFAYVVEPADEACDCYLFNLYIQNLSNDKIEWKFEIQKDVSEKNYNIDSIWNTKDSLFTAKLNQYRIVQLKDIDLQKNVLKINNKKYYYQFNKQTKFDDDYQIDWVKMGTLKITEENKPEKTVFSYKETAYSYVLNAGMSGYLKSTIDNQLAFILWHARWGYEGTPYVVSFKVVGTKLN